MINVCEKCLSTFTDTLDKEQELCSDCMMEEWKQEDKQFRREHGYEL